MAAQRDKTHPAAEKKKAEKHPVHVSIDCIRRSGLGLGDLLSSDSERLCWRAGPFQLSVGLLFGSVAMAPPPEVEAGLLCALWTARVVVRSKKTKIWQQNHGGSIWWDLRRLRLHHNVHVCRADADSATFSHQLEDRAESVSKFHLPLETPLGQSCGGVVHACMFCHMMFHFLDSCFVSLSFFFPNS